MKIPDLHPTGAPSPDGSAVLLQTDSGKTAHFTLMGKDRKVAQDIGTIARSNGAQVGFNTVNDKYAAFTYQLTDGTDGRNAQDAWQLYLFDRTTQKLTVVADAPKDAGGQPLRGGWVTPVLTDKYLYWIQAAATGLPWGGSEIQQYNLATGTTRTLYQGLAEALVPFGNDLLFTAVPANADKSVQDVPVAMLAVNQDTGTMVAAPSGITAATDGAFSFATSDGTLVWNTRDGGINGWRADWGHSVVLVPGLDATNSGNWTRPTDMRISGAGTPSIYKQFLVWFADGTYIMDLKTGSFTTLTTRPGGVNSSGSMVSLEEYASDTKPNFGDPISMNQTMIDLAKIPAFPSC
jgi:hypothetical protein